MFGPRLATTIIPGVEKQSQLSAFPLHSGFGRQRPFPCGGDTEIPLRRAWCSAGCRDADACPSPPGSTKLPDCSICCTLSLQGNSLPGSRGCGVLSLNICSFQPVLLWLLAQRAAGCCECPLCAHAPCPRRPVCVLPCTRTPTCLLHTLVCKPSCAHSCMCNAHSRTHTCTPCTPSLLRSIPCVHACVPPAGSARARVQTLKPPTPGCCGAAPRVCPQPHTRVSPRPCPLGLISTFPHRVSGAHPGA